MQRFRRRNSRHVTYANVMATLAVMFVVVGTAWAASLPKNIVTSRNIKDGQVQSRDIRNNNIGGVDVKANTLTGADILEATLGQVPSAATAISADAARNLSGRTVVPATTVSPSATNVDLNAARAAATEVPLASDGPLTVYGKCLVRSDTDEVVGYMFVRVTTGSVLVNSKERTGVVLNSATVESNRFFSLESSVDGSMSVTDYDATDFWFRTSAGAEHIGNARIVTKNLSDATVDPLFGAGDRCSFSLNFEKIA